MKKLTLLLAIFVSSSAMILSQPHIINYQGLLKNSTGVIVADGEYNITFRLYDNGLTELWNETQAINVVGGIINTQLGTVSPIALPFDNEYWLGISIGEESELSPRIKLSSVPYSFMTMNVMDQSITTSKLQNEAITSVKITDGAVSSDKLGDNSVTTSKILDATITAGDIDNNQVIKKINGIRDSVNFIAGSNISIVPGVNTITISSSGSTGGGDITAVTAGTGLTGGGTTGDVSLAVVDNGITTTMIQNSSVTSAKITDGTIGMADLAANSVNSSKIIDATITAADIEGTQVVKSLNTLKDNVTLVGGTNVTITPSGNNLTISAASGGTISGSGTTNYIPYFTGSSTLGNSVLFQKLNNIGLGTINPAYPLHVSTKRQYAGYFTSDSLSPNTHVLHSEFSGSGSFNTIGVYGKSVPSDNYGIGGYFVGGSIGTYGYVQAAGSGEYKGIWGIASGGTGVNLGVYGSAFGSGTNYGVYGISSGAGTNYGVYGSAPMYGIEGYAASTSGVADGVRGISHSTGGTGVFGYTEANSTVANYGGYFVSKSTAGYGAFGYANASSGITYGGYFRSNSGNGTGVYGYAPSASEGNSFGVWGRSDGPNGYGVYGHSDHSTGKNYGVYGITSSSNGYAVYGYGRKYAVEGFAINTSGIADGVRGVSNSTGGTGVFAWAKAATGTTYGVFSTIDSPTGFAGYFVGKVHVTGNLTKGGGAFKIDHPLDPQNKYLYHSFVESPDMKNIYDGNVITDGSGYASVALPDWFEALNKDFRYQLTVIGDFAQAVISQKIHNNLFIIRTDKPGVEVSWQVTGIRKDAYAEKNRIPVEEDKNDEERGRYLYPESFGLTKDQGIDKALRQVEAEPKITEPVMFNETEPRTDFETYNPPAPPANKIIEQ